MGNDSSQENIDSQPSTPIETVDPILDDEKPISDCQPPNDQTNGHPPEAPNNDTFFHAIYTSEDLDHLKDGQTSTVTPEQKTSTTSCEEMFDLIEEMFECDDALKSVPTSEAISKSESSANILNEPKLEKADSIEDNNEQEPIQRDSSAEIAPNNEPDVTSSKSSFDLPDPEQGSDAHDSTEENIETNAQAHYIVTPTASGFEITPRSSAVDADNNTSPLAAVDQRASVTSVTDLSEEKKASQSPTMTDTNVRTSESLSKGSLGSTELRLSKSLGRKFADGDENRESKIKSRMTLFNAYKMLKVAKDVWPTFVSLDDSEHKSIVSSFITEEIGYAKCIKYVAGFEQAIRDKLASSSKAMFSKSDNKQLAYSNLSVHMERLEKMLEKKKNGADEGFGLIDYFGELTPLRIDYKIVASSMDRFLSFIAKNKSSSKFKKILPPELHIEEWNSRIDIEQAINTIYSRPLKYLQLLHRLMSHTKNTDPAYKHMRIVTNQLILLWDVMRLSRCGKKNNNITRRLTLTTPVVELSPDGQRKYRLLYIFMDCIVLSSQNNKNSADVTVKYCFPLKKCVSSRTVPPNYNFKPNENNEKHLNFLKAKIASNIDLISKYELSNKKSDLAKADKYTRQINEDQYQLLIAEPQFPLSVCVCHKITHLFLFGSEVDAAMWDFVINGRSNCGIMDESNASSNEAQSLVNEFNNQLLKSNDDEESHYNDNFVEEPFVPPPLNDIKTEESTAAPVPYLRNCLYMNIIFKRHEELAGDIYFKVECDYYDNYFEKYKSPTIKGNDYTTHEVVALTEHSKFVRVELVRTKGKPDSFVYGPIDLCAEGILDKPFISVRKDFSNVGCLVIYAECFDTLQLVQVEQKSRIKCIDHFQSSIEQICRSEDSDVPNVLRMCTEKIESIGLETVGLYRISGTMNKMTQLREEFSKNVILENSDLDDYDIHDLCSGVKSFFRDLQHRLIPKEYIDIFVKWQRDTEDSPDIALLHDCIGKLPRHNQNAFYFLMNHLVKIVRLNNVNKMTSANLSTVFGPNLFGDNVSDIPQQESLFTYVAVVKQFIDVMASADSY